MLQLLTRIHPPIHACSTPQEEEEQQQQQLFILF